MGATVKSLLAVSNGIDHFRPPMETKFQCVRRMLFYLAASYGSIRLAIDANHQLLKWIIPMILVLSLELGYCENGRCTTITDDTGVCPSTSIQTGRRCIF